MFKHFSDNAKRSVSTTTNLRFERRNPIIFMFTLAKLVQK